MNTMHGSRRCAQRALAALAPLLGLVACTDQLPEQPEVLESFWVYPVFDAAYLASVGCGSTLPDDCPLSAGSAAAPLPYAHTKYDSFFFDIEAVGSKGTRPFAWTGEVAVTPTRGQLHPQLDPIALVDGKAAAVRVRLRRAAGVSTLFFEDRVEGRGQGASTFATGAGSRIRFAQPTIAQVQETLDEGSSPLFANNVEISAGQLVVTRVAASGFNIQDVAADRWNGLFVYSYGNPEGVAVGSRLNMVSGSVSEFLGSTQLSFPGYAKPYGRCLLPAGSEGVEDTDVEAGGFIFGEGCPSGFTCSMIETRRGNEVFRNNRCVPDDPTMAARFDPLFGREICAAASDTSCHTGMRCEVDSEEGGHYCQVIPVPAPSGAWPTTRAGEFPYCGPYHTDRESPLLTEPYEGKLITLTSSDGTLKVEGLPVCRHVDDLTSVRSTCNVTDAVPDCDLAYAGERLLRDSRGELCLRGYQACKKIAGQEWNQVRSTCLADQSLDYCDPAKSGEEVLRNPNGVVCRSTMDDLLWSGWSEYNQFKVTFRDAADQLRCATVLTDALINFDPFALQEQGGTLRSITGTLKQSRFRSGSSYWIIEVRGPEDLVR